MGAPSFGSDPSVDQLVNTCSVARRTHSDSTWPDTQRVIEEHWGHIPDDELRLMTHAKAASRFRHPLSEVTRP